MTRQITTACLLVLIGSLASVFFVVDARSKSPAETRSELLATRLAALQRGCPGIADHEAKEAQELCRNSATPFERCFWEASAVFKRYATASTKPSVSDRCKIYVENDKQQVLANAADAFSSHQDSGLARLLSESPSTKRSDVDSQFRNMQHALGQPKTGCAGLNSACPAHNQSDNARTSDAAQ